MKRSALKVVLTTVFSLLMLGMQLEGQRHALQHLGDQLHRAHEQGVQLPQGEVACAECALLAGTSSAIASGSVTTPVVLSAAERIDDAFSSQRVAAPAYYSSRAPPALL